MFHCFIYFALTARHEELNSTCLDKSESRDCTDELKCIEGFCSYCKDEGSLCRDYFYCGKVEAYDGNICKFEPFLHKWSIRLILSMCVIFIAGVLVSGAGIGGGGLFVPILILLMEFPTNRAIPSSKALIFGGSVAVTLFNLRKKHNFYARPLINYNVAAIIEPTAWLGTIVGVIFNEILPPWLLYAVQFFLLSFTAWNTFKKAAKAKDDGAEILEDLHEQYNGPAYSKFLFLLLFIAYALFLFLSFIRGGRTSDSILGIEFCSAQYWLLTFVPFPVYLTLTWFIFRVAKNYPVIGNKAKTTFKDFLMLLGCGFVSGIASGFLGIGGGMIKAPLLLALDIEAEEMAATSTFMILLTSSITSIQFMILGSMKLRHFCILGAVSFVSFLIGAIFLRWLVRKFGTRSTFLYVLASIILISAILMAVLGVLDVVNDVRRGIPMGFMKYC
jgi:uncharacterized membrane protein YfcA